MRMLGEMACSMTGGSFYEYAREAWRDKPAVGQLAGFLTGWMYWYFWVIVVAIEAVAGADLVRYWLPDVPNWSISLVLLVMLTLMPPRTPIRLPNRASRLWFATDQTRR